MPIAARRGGKPRPNGPNASGGVAAQPLPAGVAATDAGIESAASTAASTSRLHEITANVYHSDRSDGRRPRERLREAPIRLARLATATPAAVTPATATPMMFVVAQVRHALQQTAAIGACSPYFPAAWAIRPAQICFMTEM